MSDRPPQLVILAGPNGAGKTTASKRLLRDTLAVSPFVNADTIARGLSEFEPESAAIEAGKIMISRMRDLVAKRTSFAIETTLASRSLAGFIRTARKDHGYSVTLYFLWLPSADLAVKRVAERVLLGGHHVPEEVVRRRYERGIANFVSLYIHMVDEWAVYNSSESLGLSLVATGGMLIETLINSATVWDNMLERR